MTLKRSVHMRAIVVTKDENNNVIGTPAQFDIAAGLPLDENDKLSVIASAGVLGQTYQKFVSELLEGRIELE